MKEKACGPSCAAGSRVCSESIAGCERTSPCARGERGVMAWADGTVRAVSRNDELERYRAALRRQLNTEFVERWGACERGHVLTDLNRDRQGRCWCCTRAHERAFE